MKLCRSCKTEKPLEEFRKRGKNKDRVYSYCYPCNTRKALEYRNNHPDKKKLRQKECYLRRYNITPEEVENMKISQDNKCKICLKPLNAPQVDHCHSTGKVRGLLCGKCNRGLGMFEDSPDLLRQAAEYVRSA